MFIQFHTDNYISATDEVTAALSESIAHTLDRFSHQVSSVQVYLSDENAKKPGQNDKRCVLEARLDGMEPIAVTGRAATIDQALKTALDKMKTSLDTRRDRLRTY
jgi:ribosome-associated translation inhibitor RaiA